MQQQQSTKKETTTMRNATYAHTNLFLFCDGCGKTPFLTNDRRIIPLRRCVRCRCAYYHNKDCQKQHWERQHKNECCQFISSYLSIEERIGRGKCLIATKPIENNQQISKILIGEKTKNNFFEPIVPCVLFRKHQTTHCAVCFQKITSTMEMQNISTFLHYPVVVCSKECKQSWLIDEINVINTTFVDNDFKPSIMEIFPAIILVYRIILAITKEEKNNFLYKEILDIKTHYDGTDSKAIKHQQAVSSLLVEMIATAAETNKVSNNNATIIRNILLSRILEKTRTDPYELVLQILNRVQYNTFTVTIKSDDDDKSNDSLGIGLYEFPSYMINRSRDDPNIIQNFVFSKNHTSPKLQFYTIKSISSGDEICIS